jgi:glycosyltransferase involved in cell wall biosynthesis
MADVTPKNHDPRPRLAYVVHLLYPFRLHVQQRVAREVPELKLHTLVSWNQERHQWRFEELDEIGLTYFPEGVTEEEHATLWHKPRDWHAGRQLISWFEEHRPAMVVMCGYAFPSHFRAIGWLRRNKVPYMLWSDSNVLDDTSTGIKRAIKNRVVGPIVREAKAVLVCGTNGAKYYERYGATPERTFFCPVVPDYQLIEECPAERIEATRLEFGLPAGRRRFLHCARLIPLKSSDNVVRAFVRLAARRPAWDLIIVGDGPCRAELEALVPAGLKDRVRFTGFTSNQATTAAIQRCCDVLVHPGYSEAWGVVLIEAAAAGMAIVASDVVGAAADFVEDGVNGRLVPPRSVERLEAAMLEVSENDARLASMKAASRRIGAEFRAKADPVAGLRKALAKAGVIGTP